MRSGVKEHGLKINEYPELKTTISHQDIYEGKKLLDSSNLQIHIPNASSLMSLEKMAKYSKVVCYSIVM